MKKFLTAVSILTAVCWASSAFALTPGTNISLQNGQVSITGQIGLANGGTGADNSASGPGVWQQSSGNVFSVGTLNALDGNFLTSTCANGQVLMWDTAGTPDAFVCANAAVDTTINGIIGAGTQFDITQGTTLYVGLAGSVDTTEARVTVPMTAATFDDIYCASSVDPGGTGQSYAITMRKGACGSEADSTLTCTIATGSTTCTGSVADSVTAGQCVSLSVVASAAAASGTVQCTMQRTA